MSARAVIYLRVSTARQAETDYDADGYSILAQREACIRKAEELGAIVVEEFVDRGESARSADRPELQRLLKHLLETGDVDFVIVHKIDRLARNREDDVSLHLAIRTSGARLVSVSENIDETPTGMLLHGIMASVAEFYSRNLATEIKKGLVQKAKLGGTTSRAPIGYSHVRDLVDGREIRTVIPDPERGPIIQAAFVLYATGEYSHRSLLGAMLDMGLTTQTTKTRTSKPLHISMVGKILQNRYYAGFITYKGVEYPGRHQPLVDERTFREVQRISAEHDLAGERPRKHFHYLKGSLFCGQCGNRLSLSNSMGKMGVYYLYWYCPNRARAGCPQKYVQTDVIEAAVVRYYSNVGMASEQIEDIHKHLVGLLVQRRAAAGKIEKTLKRQLQALTAQTAKLMEGYYAGAVPLDLLKTEQNRITSERERIDTHIAGLTKDFDRVAANLDKAAALVRRPELAYETAGNTLRRKYNQTFFAKLFVDGPDVVGAELAEPFSTIHTRDLVTTLKRAHSEGEAEEADEHKNPNPSQDWGSRYINLVEMMGIEPTTSSMRTKRSAK